MVSLAALGGIPLIALKQKDLQAVDARFDTSKWAEAGPSRHKATAATLPPADAGADAAMDEEEEEEEEGGEEEDEDEEGGEDEDGDGGEDEEGRASPQAQKRKRVLEPDALDAFASKQAKRGIVYISYIPRGMTVAKVRHLLGQFGDVERIFLQDGDEKRSGVKRSSRGCLCRGEREPEEKKSTLS